MRGARDFNFKMGKYSFYLYWIEWDSSYHKAFYRITIYKVEISGLVHRKFLLSYRPFAQKM